MGWGIYEGKKVSFESYVEYKVVIEVWNKGDYYVVMFSGEFVV